MAAHEDPTLRAEAAVDVLATLRASLEHEREALGAGRIDAIIQSTEAKTAALRAAARVPARLLSGPQADARVAELVRDCAQRNRANAALLSVRMQRLADIRAQTRDVAPVYGRNGGFASTPRQHVRGSV